MKINEEVRNIILDWSKKSKIEIIFTKDGVRLVPKLERKGAYVMELDDLNYDLPIVNKALVDYMTRDIPVEDTINNCNDLREFQKIVKISSNYKMAWHNNEYFSEKTFRLFASKDVKDTYLGKIKRLGATIEKFANTPEHCFIKNDCVVDCPMSNKLDKKWYIDLARKRLKDFGIFVSENDGRLF